MLMYKSGEGVPTKGRWSCAPLRSNVVTVCFATHLLVHLLAAPRLGAAVMNWNNKDSTMVAKERIWREFIASENRGLTVFDNFQRTDSSLRAHMLPIAISNRRTKFLDRDSATMEMSFSHALPELRNDNRSMSPFGEVVARSPLRCRPSLPELRSPSGTQSPTCAKPHGSSLTSSSEIGARVAPLITHRFRLYYGLKRGEITKQLRAE
jgi:hypothetical protein